MKTSRISMNQIEVVTASYRWVHGHAPKGRGSWAFAIGNKNRQKKTRMKFSGLRLTLCIRMPSRKPRRRLRSAEKQQYMSYRK